MIALIRFNSKQSQYFRYKDILGGEPTDHLQPPLPQQQRRMQEALFPGPRQLDSKGNNSQVRHFKKFMVFIIVSLLCRMLK